MAGLSEAERATLHAMAESLPADLSHDATVKASPEVLLARGMVSLTLPATEPALSIELSELPSLTVGGSLEDASPTESHADLEITEVLGEGGMGIVYSARQRSLKRDVALKVVRSESHHPGQLSVLLHEARLMGSLEHPGVIPVHALGRDASGRPLFVMKRIEGTSWQDLLRSPDHEVWAAIGKQSRDRLLAHLEILMHVASTIAFAHSRGILHRDIKPANVLVGSFGEVYVADWGIATEKEAALGGWPGPLGTPSFMAPEMVLGDPMDERTDVYLLGATLHQILSGRPRHDGARVVDVLLSARESAPPSYDVTVPRALGDLARRATARDKSDRPASALAFRDELAEYLTHRASLELSARGADCLSRAEAARRASNATLGATERALLVEGRFAFAQALREWPGNPTARAGMDRLLEATFEAELAERALGACAAALAEMSTPRDDLEKKLAGLRSALRVEGRERDEARKLVRDHDPSIARRNRTLFLVFLAVAGAGLTLGMRSFRRDGSLPGVRTVLLPLGLGIALAPVAAWFRADLAKSAVNRRFLAIVYGLIGASTFLRALGYRFQTDIDHLMTFELVIFGTAAAMLAITFHRAFGLVAMGTVLCAIGAYALPEWLEIFYVAPLFSIVAVSAFVQKPAEASSGERTDETRQRPDKNEKR